MDFINEQYNNLKHASTVVIDFGVKTVLVIWEKEDTKKSIAVYKFNSLYANKPYYKRNCSLEEAPNKYKQATNRLIEIFNRKYSC